jgi:hypothetical protein
MIKSRKTQNRPYQAPHIVHRGRLKQFAGSPLSAKPVGAPFILPEMGKE